jgi:beta-N-acetylhexosaminidase
MKCRRILMLKYQMGLPQRPVIKTTGLFSDLNPPGAAALRNMLYNSAITLIKDDVQLIPLKSLDRRRLATISVGDTTLTPFQERANLYAGMDHFNISLNPGKKLTDSLIDRLSGYHIILAGLHRFSSFPADSFGLSRNVLHFLDTLFRENRCILSVFGNPYALAIIPGLKNAEAIIESYQDNPVAEEMTAELIFGGIPAKGRLPVSVAAFKAGTGEKTEKNRLEFVLPEELGIPSPALEPIDSTAISGIKAGAYPGCQVLFAKGGKVFYKKSFGNPTYGDSILVTNEDIYDIASVTKIAATTLALMKLYDDGKIRLDDSLGSYLPELRGSNKSGLILRDVLTHQAGLISWVPFYEKTITAKGPDPGIYQPESSMAFPLRVAENLYILKSYPDSVYQFILSSPLRASRDYKYSDLGFYLLKRIVERQSGKPFDQYLGEVFYKPLGLQSIGFHPLERFNRKKLMPSEKDTVFRGQVIWGDVNDPGAAMLGGISGHAGLFSNALDLAVIMQMLIQNGQYGGRQYIQPKTVREFTRVQFPQNGNRRGLGFDKPLLNPSPEGPCYEGASPSSFGHTGFTGILVWADPTNDLVYIFLSNRTFPDSKNTKLAGMNIRTNIQKIAYDLLKKYRIK